jgi:hypothetical protein
MMIRINIESGRHLDIHHKEVISNIQKAIILIHFTPKEEYHQEDRKYIRQALIVTINQAHTDLNLIMIVGDDVLLVYLV